MNIYRFSILFILSLCTSLVNSQEINEGKSLKVITYNIWNGFDWGKDTFRQEKFVNWIDSQKPDVVALQELCGFTNEKLTKLAKSWGHDYTEILKTEGYPVGITSSKPIEVKERIFENMHHGALHCQTWGVNFMIVHLSPFNYEKRHEETDVILSKLAKVKATQDKYIVLGDFNAVSPFDAHFYANNMDMLKSKRESETKHDHVRNLLYGALEYGTISSYLSFPLIDVVQRNTAELEQRISYPTQVFENEKGDGRSSNSTRIDYMLASPLLGHKCTNAQVVNGEATYYLSDHYPVLAEFEIE